MLPPGTNYITIPCADRQATSAFYLQIGLVVEPTHVIGEASLMAIDSSLKFEVFLPASSKSKTSKLILFAVYG